MNCNISRKKKTSHLKNILLVVTRVAAINAENTQPTLTAVVTGFKRPHNYHNIPTRKSPLSDKLHKHEFDASI